MCLVYCKVNILFFVSPLPSITILFDIVLNVSFFFVFNVAISSQAIYVACVIVFTDYVVVIKDTIWKVNCGNYF